MFKMITFGMDRVFASGATGSDSVLTCMRTLTHHPHLRLTNLVYAGVWIMACSIAQSTQIDVIQRMLRTSSSTSHDSHAGALTQYTVTAHSRLRRSIWRTKKWTASSIAQLQSPRQTPKWVTNAIPNPRTKVVKTMTQKDYAAIWLILMSLPRLLHYGILKVSITSETTPKNRMDECWPVQIECSVFVSDVRLDLREVYMWLL